MEDVQQREATAETIERLAKQEVKVIVGEVSRDRAKKHYAIVPSGMEVKNLDFLDAQAPQRSFTFIDAESFSNYVKDYSNEDDSRLFASLHDMRLKCAIDYTSKCKFPDQAIAGNEDHVVFYDLAETEDYKAFLEIDGKVLNQEAFISFLTERSHCFANPDQATILEIATKLDVKNNVTFSGKERTNDGGINLTYREDVEARVGQSGKIKVPDFVNLVFQAFEGGEKIEFRARFYFKLANGAVLFQVKLLNLRETVLKNFRKVCDAIAKDTGLPCHYTL